MQLLYQGKAKQILATQDPHTIIVRFTDTVTAGNGKKRESIPGKGALAAQISIKLFELLSTQNIPTHYIRPLDQQSFLAKKVQIIPLEVVVRTCAAGSIVKRLGLARGHIFTPPLVELFYKSDALHDPLICDAHALALHLATAEELAHIKELARKAAALLTDYFAQRNLKLVDMKFEFGRVGEGPGEGSRILLADEISPDTMRLWDAHTNESLDKDVFREDKGDLLATYREVARRMGVKNLTLPLSVYGEGTGEVGTGEVGTGEVGL
jgi:phosphoribosylaminoimidazole-succinocarboxamide synthase